MAGQGWRQRLCLAVVPNAIGRRSTDLGNLIAQFAHFGVRRDTQALDLLFQSPNAANLAYVGWNTPEEQITRNVERTGRNVSTIRVGLHALRARELFAKAGIGQAVNLAVRSQQGIARRPIERLLFALKFRRDNKARFAEVLVA